MSFRMGPETAHHFCRDAQHSPAVVPWVGAQSRAGEARQRTVFTASEASVRAVAWGWLRLFAGSSATRSFGSEEVLRRRRRKGLARGVCLTGRGS